MAIKQCATADGARIALDPLEAINRGSVMSEADITFASLPDPVQTALGSGGAGQQANNDFRSMTLRHGGKWITVYFSRAETADAGSAVT